MIKKDTYYKSKLWEIERYGGRERALRSPSIVEKNLPIEMHWFNIELIKY